MIPTSIQLTDAMIRRGVREFWILLRLAGPMMAAQLGQMSMGVMDMIMVGHASSVDQAAVALGSNLMWPAMILFVGLLMAIPPTVAQLRGAGRSREVGAVMRQAVWLALFAAAATVGVLICAPQLYAQIGSDPEVAAVASVYLRAICIGIPGMLGYFMLRYLCEGLAMPKPAMVVVWSALALKVPLNLWLIYGGFGLPALGAVGCGVATAVVMWFQFLAMVWVVTHLQIGQIGLFERFSWPAWEPLSRLLWVGLPIGLTTFFEVGLFSVTGLLVSRLGTEAIAGHQIALQFGNLAFMVPLALGQAATVRVGFHVGAWQLVRARRSAWIAVLASLAVGVVAGAMIFGGRGPVAALFNPDPAVVEVAVGLLLFVAIFQIFDALQATTIGVLRGFKDTRVPMLVAMVCYWMVALPLGICLAEGYFGVWQGLAGYWVALIVGLGCAALLLAGRLLWVSADDQRIVRLSALGPRPRPERRRTMLARRHH